MQGTRSRGASEDLRRFARRIPYVAAAAVLAGLAGAVATAVFRAAAGPSGSPVIERAVYVLVATVVAGPTVAWAYSARLWSIAESTVALLASASSLWVGPVLFSIARSAGLVGRSVADQDALVSETNLVWMFAMFVVLLPLEYYVWSAYAIARVRETYTRVWQSTHGSTSADIGNRRIVLDGITALRRQETSGSSPLVAAVVDWYRAWLAHPEGVPHDIGIPLVERIDATMTGMFGPKYSPS